MPHVIRLTNELAGVGPPDEFLIFPFGEVHTSKGTFLFDEEAAKSVLSAWQDQGNDLALDYEHQALEDPPIEAPAAGWFKLELRPEGLFAVGIRWTEKAAERLRKKEYRFTSPAFVAERETGRILRLINVALTNIPATKHMAPLVAAKAVPYSSGELLEGAWDADAAIGRLRRWASKDGSGSKEQMDWAKYRRAFAWYDVENPDDFGAYKLPHHDVRDGELVVAVRGVFAAAAVVQGSRGGVDIPESDLPEVRAHLEKHYHQWDAMAPWEEREMAAAHNEEEKKMKTDALHLLLGFEKDRGEGETLAAVTRLRDFQREVLALSGKENPSEALGVLHALKQAAAQVEALSQRVAALEDEKREAEVISLVDTAQRDGKVTPAQRETMLHMGRKDLAMLKSFLETAPKVIPLGEARHPPAPSADGLLGKKWEELKPMEKHRLFEEHPELYRAARAEHEERQAR